LRMNAPERSVSIEADLRRGTNQRS
jgi:hypothetical protein